MPDLPLYSYFERKTARLWSANLLGLLEDLLGVTTSTGMPPLSMIRPRKSNRIIQIFSAFTNQSLHLTAGRFGAPRQIVKTHPVQASLAAASGS